MVVSADRATRPAPSGETITVHGTMGPTGFMPWWAEVVGPSMIPGYIPRLVPPFVEPEVPEIPEFPLDEEPGFTEELLPGFEPHFELPALELPGVGDPVIDFMESFEGFFFPSTRAAMNFFRMRQAEFKVNAFPGHHTIVWTVRGWQWVHILDDGSVTARHPQGPTEPRNVRWSFDRWEWVEHQTLGGGWNDFPDSDTHIRGRRVRTRPVWDEISAQSVLEGAARLALDIEPSHPREMALQALVRGIGALVVGDVDAYVTAMVEVRTGGRLRDAIVRALGVLLAGALGTRLAHVEGGLGLGDAGVTRKGVRVLDGLVFAEAADEGEVEVKIFPIPVPGVDVDIGEVVVPGVGSDAGVIPDSLAVDTLEGVFDEAVAKAVELATVAAGADASTEAGLEVEISFPVRSRSVRTPAWGIPGRWSLRGEPIVVTVAPSVPTRAQTIAREATPQKDTKTDSQRSWLALLTLTSRTFGTVSELGDFALVVLRALRHEKTGKGFTSWAAAMRARDQGLLEFNQDEFMQELLKENLTDVLFAKKTAAEASWLRRQFGEGSLINNAFGLPSTWARRLGY